MQPLSRIKRRFYLVLLALLFALVVPTALLVAGGWSYKRGFGFVRTGGVYVHVPTSDVTVSIDGEEVGVSTFLDHGFYVGDLAPSSYVVRAERPGYRTWERTLVVEPQLVTDAEAVLVAERVSVPRLAVSGTATDTRAISRALYAEYERAFASATTSAHARATSGAMHMRIAGDSLTIDWAGDTRPPSVFCGRPSFCNGSLTITRRGERFTRAEFYGQGIVYSTREGGVFFSEVDIKPGALTVALFPHAGAEFRIVDDALVVRHEGELYEVLDLDF